MSLPNIARGIERLLSVYESSALGDFHRRFYAELRKRGAPVRSLDLASIPPCVSGALLDPNDRLLKAELAFDDAEQLINFWSDDRRRASADGSTMELVRWSTPIGSYRAFGPFRLGGRGEGRWRETTGEYAYVQIELDEVQYNVRSR